MPKPVLSRSSLARPVTLIHELAAKIQEHIYLPDPSPLYVVLGTLAANMLPGAVPVWVMLVGPTGRGKTMWIEGLREIPKVYITSAIKTTAALLSGTKEKEKAKTATGGILRQMGKRGMICPKDFTGTLSLDPKYLREMIGAFRDIYDKVYDRSVGTDGGKKLIWDGCLGFLGGCTPDALERHHAAIQEMGSRWIYYRFPDTDGFGEAQSALRQDDKEKVTAELRQLILEFIEVIGLEWHCYYNCKEGHEHVWGERRALTIQEEHRAISLGTIAAKCRSTLPRDAYRPDEITGIGEPETPIRLIESFKQLCLGFEAIGLPENESWKLIGKMAADCAPRLRMRILGLLYEVRKEDGRKIFELAKRTGCGVNTVRRAVEDMTYFGLIEKGEESGNYKLMAKTQRMMEVGWSEGE